MKFLFNPSVDNIDDVPEDFRALYEEGEDDKHVLKSDDFSKSAISAAPATLLSPQGVPTGPAGIESPTLMRG